MMTAKRPTLCVWRIAWDDWHAIARSPAMSDLRNFRGGCHCGQVRFEVTTDLAEVVCCNCSICTKRGLLLNFVTPQHFALRAGSNELADYQFNRKVIHHQFCPVCGVESFARGTKPDGTAMIAVNVRCLEGVDIDSLRPTSFDGRSL
jgi:hypothetical protein